MEFEGFPRSVDWLSSSGILLSAEKKSCLQSSLILMKRENKFSHVKLWGIIRGIQNDYYIAQGVGKDELDRKALYSQDCWRWNLLPHVDESLKTKSAMLQGRFTGDVSYVNERKVTSQTGEGEDSHEQIVTIEIKEEDRLAAVVARIDADVGVVPLGAYLRTALNSIIINKSFHGLSLSDAKLLKYYQHFKGPVVDDVTKTIMQAVDFLPTIDKDIPKGCWTIQCDNGGEVVILRSLRWIGMVAYHVPGTPEFGYFYSGNGEENHDLLFML